MMLMIRELVSHIMLIKKSYTFYMLQIHIMSCLSPNWHFLCQLNHSQFLGWEEIDSRNGLSYIPKIYEFQPYVIQFSIFEIIFLNMLSLKNSCYVRILFMLEWPSIHDLCVWYIKYFILVVPYLTPQVSSWVVR